GRRSLLSWVLDEATDWRRFGHWRRLSRERCPDRVGDVALGDLLAIWVVVERPEIDHFPFRVEYHELRRPQRSVRLAHFSRGILQVRKGHLRPPRYLAHDL